MAKSWWLLMVVGVLAGCASTESTKNTAAPVNKMSESDGLPVFTGTIRKIELDGGFYGIIGDNGKFYDPVNLGPAYQVEGLKIRFKAKFPEDITTIHMWGRATQVVEIEAAAEPKRTGRGVSQPAFR